jgi:plastocyanin
MSTRTLRPFMTAVARHRVQALLALALLTAACTDDAVAPSADPNNGFWRLELNAEAVNLSLAAPWDTFRLVATPRTADGSVMNEAGTVSFISQDTLIVRVDADGLMHAVGFGFAFPVIARMSVGNLTHVDTVLVNSLPVDDPPVLASLSIQPIPPDSAKHATGTSYTERGQYVVTPVALDPIGDPIDGLLVRFASLDPRVATIDPLAGLVMGLVPGYVKFVATTTAYGITLADTLDFTIGQPLVDGVIFGATSRGGFYGLPQFRPVFTRDSIEVTVGTLVAWQNPYNQATDVVFEDPTNVSGAEVFWLCQFYGVSCEGGNIEPFSSDPASGDPTNGTRARIFNTLGTYRYHSTVYPEATGVVVVVPEVLP